MTDIAVIILTKNEKLHIRRCLERLMPLEPRQIFIVDCFSTDETKAIVSSFSTNHHPQNTNNYSSTTNNNPLTTNYYFVEHEWPGNQATQFNWALNNLPIKAKWVLRLDADEYLTPETIERIKAGLPNLPKDVMGLTLELKRRFMGGEIRHGTRGIRLMRVFRYGIGRCEERAMDEHIILDRGRSIDFDGAFYDDNLNLMDWWREKHQGYAKREARMAVFGAANTNKRLYYKLPPYLRAFAYFCYRYFFRLGFLDGYAGWMWHFWQGLWYRCLVDKDISLIKRGKEIHN